MWRITVPNETLSMKTGYYCITVRNGGICYTSRIRTKYGPLLVAIPFNRLISSKHKELRHNAALSTHCNDGDLQSPAVSITDLRWINLH